MEVYQFVAYALLGSLRTTQCSPLRQSSESSV